ncbi:MAG: NADH-quinone oxidoreductase subunit H [Candidatus Omnitrophota bacterium]
MNLLLNFFIFPGFLFSVCAGLMACWLDRKVSARLQWRQGPPWHQSFTDIIKLLGKETIVPQGAKWTFLLAPYFGFLSLILSATILGKAIISPLESFAGDIIVILYLLMIPALCLIIGASSSRNPLASVGASREMKLILSYELPFILTIITIIIKSGGVIGLGGIINTQSFSSYFFSFSGVLSFIVAIFCMQAKLGFTPFEISEAEQEIMGGVLIEYSGLPLAVFKLNKALLLYIMPLLLIVLFLGKDLSGIFITLKFIGILVIIILIKNTNPRLRIDQALRFFWGPVTITALAAIGLALIGK